MNVTLRRALLVCVLAGSLALALALAAGTGPAEAESSVVGPGESIQKAVNAAHPGDTIVVKGVHREDVVISKDGIKLRGEDAVIEPPPKADSPCAPEAICIRGNVTQTGEITGPRVSDVSVSGFTIRGFRDRGQPAFSIDVAHARNATVAGNRVKDTTGRIGGIGVTARSIDTTFANNHVIGNPDSSASGIRVEYSSLTTIAKNVIRNIPEGENAIDVAEGSADTTIAQNEFEDDWVGPFVVDSPGTKILSNDVSHSGIVGMFLAGQKSADTKVVGNDISGGPWGIFVTDAHQGSFVGNTIHDNCAGMFFEAFKSQPVGGFKVKGNTVQDNSRSCRGQKFGRAFSGIGIALLGASGMEGSGNRLSGNVPSGPTRISGGVVVSKDPYFRGTPFGGTQKPTNNSVIGNRFGRNKPDIFYDGSGSGNQFRANFCNTSVPKRLCD
jgi:nitrous oxidase accessory protein NosD